MKPLIVGTRGSALALAQAEMTEAAFALYGDALQTNPDNEDLLYAHSLLIPFNGVKVKRNTPAINKDQPGSVILLPHCASRGYQKK